MVKRLDWEQRASDSKTKRSLEDEEEFHKLTSPRAGSSARNRRTPSARRADKPKRTGGAQRRAVATKENENCRKRNTNTRFRKATGPFGRDRTTSRLHRALGRISNDPWRSTGVHAQLGSRSLAHERQAAIKTGSSTEYYLVWYLSPHPRAVLPNIYSAVWYWPSPNTRK